MNPLVALLGLGLVTAPLPTVDVVSPTGTIHVGDPVIVEIAVEVPADALPAFPEWEESWGDAEILNVGEIRSVVTSYGTQRVSQQLTVTFFRTGEVTLPSPPMRLSSDPPDGNQSKPSEPPPGLTLTVDSLLPPGEEIPEPQPPAAPLPLGWGTSFLWTAALLALLSLAGLAVLLRRRWSETEPFATQVDPLAALATALDELRTGTGVEEMFEGMSIHLRRFFGQTMAFPAAESTTSEIRLQLRSRDLPTDLIKRTDDFLRQCDGVKFARKELPREEADNGLENVIAIGVATLEAIAPPPPAEETEETS
jgi:hypothetical protein